MDGSCKINFMVLMPDAEAPPPVLQRLQETVRLAWVAVILAIKALHIAGRQHRWRQARQAVTAAAEAQLVGLGAALLRVAGLCLRYRVSGAVWPQLRCQARHGCSSDST